MESQHTIGYGFRYMTDNCPPAYVILSIQLVVGVFLQTMLTGIVLAKVLRPKKRKQVSEKKIRKSLEKYQSWDLMIRNPNLFQEMRFSRMAVIGPLDEHDRRPALMIRLADVQEKLFLAESHKTTYYNAHILVTNNSEEVVQGAEESP
ncbi:hypothetical protein ANCDUO_20847, partial [Ancylostoma duodenale]